MFKKLITKINKSTENSGKTDARPNLGLPAHQIWHYCTVFWKSLNKRRFCTKRAMLNNVNNSNKKTMPKLVCGFTLVETLVAISILMLSVTGPLYYASESLKAATYAKDQITAFYLAQDAFEQIRKIRDDNVYGDGSLGWNIGLNGCEATSCRVAPNEGSFYTIENTNSPSTDYYSLFLNPISGVYSHDSSNTKTIFGREILIEPMDATDPSLDLWEGATEMKVTVKIKWNSRGTPREFTAYEFLRALNTL